MFDEDGFGCLGCKFLWVFSPSHHILQKNMNKMVLSSNDISLLLQYNLNRLENEQEYIFSQLGLAIWNNRTSHVEHRREVEVLEEEEERVEVHNDNLQRLIVSSRKI